MEICWGPALAVGRSEIDEQHRELFSCADGFVVACRQGCGQEYVAKALQFLERYAVRHFGHEEALMARHGYPAVAKHRAKHLLFIRRSTELKWAVRTNGPGPDVIDMTGRLMLGWLAAHIQADDVALVAYLSTIQEVGAKTVAAV